MDDNRSAKFLQIVNFLLNYVDTLADLFLQWTLFLTKKNFSERD